MAVRGLDCPFSVGAAVLSLVSVCPSLLSVCQFANTLVYAACTRSLTAREVMQDLPSELWDVVACTLDDTSKAALALASAIGWTRPWAPHALTSHRFAYARHQLAMKLHRVDPFYIFTMPKLQKDPNVIDDLGYKPPPMRGFWPWSRHVHLHGRYKHESAAYVERILRHCDSRIEVRREVLAFDAPNAASRTLYVHFVKSPPRKPRSEWLAAYKNGVTKGPEYMEEYRKANHAAWEKRMVVRHRASQWNQGGRCDARRKQKMHSSMAVEAETAIDYDDEENAILKNIFDDEDDAARRIKLKEWNARHLVQVAQMVASSIWEEGEENEYDELEDRVMKKVQRRVSQKRRALW